MQRCIQLAKSNMGTVAPNPMVGCVIVVGDEIIGEGYTSAFGGPHAEVNAIHSVEDKSKLKDATLFVSLEPCSHFGKTPPCADLIVKHNIPQVVIGIQDPNQKVAGKGISRLKEAGCEVAVGVLQAECKEVNRRFFTYHQHKRPYIVLKWAQSADGFIAPDKNLRSNEVKPYWITNKYSRQLVHQWRSQEQAILAGTKTVLDDNPHLNTRDWAGKSPIRILLDKSLKIPADANALNEKVTTYILTSENNTEFSSKGPHYRQLDFSKEVAQQICDVLWEEQIISVLIEGGAKTIDTFIKAGLWDEARIFKGKASFKEGIKAPHITGQTMLYQTIGEDELKTIRRD